MKLTPEQHEEIERRAEAGERRVADMILTQVGAGAWILQSPSLGVFEQFTTQDAAELASDYVVAEIIKGRAAPAPETMADRSEECASLEQSLPAVPEQGDFLE